MYLVAVNRVNCISRTGKATELFAERMKSIEQKNAVKTKSKMAPVIATIGRFSSAFRRFETHEEVSGIKAKHSTLSASVSVSKDSKTSSNLSSKVIEQKKLPRIPYDDSFYDQRTSSTVSTEEDAQPINRTRTNSAPSTQRKLSPTRLVRTPVYPDSTSPPTTPNVKTHRTPNIPVESSRLMRTVRKSSNAPDVVAATLQSGRDDQQTSSDPSGQSSSPKSSDFSKQSSNSSRKLSDVRSRSEAYSEVDTCADSLSLEGPSSRQLGTQPQSAISNEKRVSECSSVHAKSSCAEMLFLNVEV